MKFTVEKVITSRKVARTKIIEADSQEEATALAKAADYEYDPNPAETYEINVRPVQPNSP